MNATPISRRDVPMNTEAENRVLPLLRALISCLRRSLETPLQFEIDSEGIAGFVLKDFPDVLPGGGASRLGEWEWAKVEPVLNALVERLLWEPGKWVDPAPLPGIPPPGSNDPNPAVSEAAHALAGGRHPLARWLERFYQAMRQVHPRAIDIAGLRLEGFQERDIAGRIGFGLRLVRSILNGMQANWRTAAGGD